ncbi:MAG: DUF502 domain-containing protein [Planctomycetota bacterium]|nr:DUF502 domain-containing protein [Planctomycetota bacterium]
MKAPGTPGNPGNPGTPVEDKSDSRDASADISVDAPRKSFARRMGVGFMQTFAKGLIAILPVGVAIIVIVWMARTFEDIFAAPIQRIMVLLRVEHHYVSGLGFVLGLTLIFLLGLFVNALIVRQMLAASEGLLQRLPVAKTIMSSVRDVTGFFSKSERKQMNQVVVVRLAESGVRAVGFVTRESLMDLPEGMAKPETVAVFMPLSYAMGGFTLLVPRECVTPVSMSMEDAMRFVLTAGMKSEKPGPEGVEEKG